MHSWYYIYELLVLTPYGYWKSCINVKRGNQILVLISDELYYVFLGEHVQLCMTHSLWYSLVSTIDTYIARSNRLKYSKYHL